MTVLTARDLDARRFAHHELDTLFQAILIDDDVDAQTSLPDRITLDHDPAILLDSYRVSRQLWIEGVDQAQLLGLVRSLGREGDLDVGNRAAFKHARAKLKHVRFAFALFGDGHRYPTVMNWTTTALGHLQDAFRTGQRTRVKREAMLCRLLLSAAARSLLRREHDRFVPATAADFRAFVRREVTALERVVAAPDVTGAEFHAARKIASRQVAFYNSILAVAPMQEALLMSRSLAAINGLMGGLHDELVERRVASVQDYHRDRFALPAAIRERIIALVDRYRVSGL